MFLGNSVALVTPMHTDGSIDRDAFLQLLDWHIAANTSALILVGTTGECATVLPSEQLDIIKLAVKHVAKRVPVIVGTGTNATQTTIQRTQAAEAAGADGCLIVTPYYNKPTQQGLHAHYQHIAHATSLPIILYNVPSRTACDLLPETIAKLAPLKNIIGVKEATGKMERIQQILTLCGDDFLVYSGDDATALSAILNGAKGVISVTANIAPRSMQAMCQAALNKNVSLAEKINEQLMLLHERLFIESNPAPVKWALYEMRKIQPGIRLPLLPLNQQYHSTVREALQLANRIELEL